MPSRAHYPIQYENQPQQTCCAGCQAVAQTIIDSGQGAYYVHRTALPVTPQQIEAELAQLGLYDLPEIQQSFVRVEDEHIREAALMLENIVCAAWPANALTLVRCRLRASNQIVDRLPIRPDTLRNAIAAVKEPSRVDVPLGAATTCKLMQNCSAL